LCYTHNSFIISYTTLFRSRLFRHAPEMLRVRQGLQHLDGDGNVVVDDLAFAPREGATADPEVLHLFFREEGLLLARRAAPAARRDRKSTRLNSSHVKISYA